MNDHFCSPSCEEKNEPCDLCLGQRRKREEDKLRAEGKPTLKHNPFAVLKDRKPL